MYLVCRWSFGMSMEDLIWLMCPVCKKTIYIKIDKEKVKNVKRYPFPIIVHHNDHTLVVYLDSHFAVADAEQIIDEVSVVSK